MLTTSSRNINTMDCSNRKVLRTHAFLATLLLSLFAASAQADELYSFGFTPTTGSIHGFTFSFTVPTFVTTGQSPAFAPIPVTDGVNSWSLTTDWAENFSGGSCFFFQTATQALIDPNGACSSSISAPAGGEFALYLPTALPTADGTYTDSSASALFYVGTTPDDSLGVGTLTITSPVPEPSAVLLMSTMLAVVALVARKRIARGLNPATRMTS